MCSPVAQTLELPFLFMSVNVTPSFAFPPIGVTNQEYYLFHTAGIS